MLSRRTLSPLLRHLGLEHLQCDDVDEHDPDGGVQKLGLVLHEGDGGDALALKFGPGKKAHSRTWFYVVWCTSTLRTKR